MSTKPEETTTAPETPATEPAAPATDAPLSDAALDGVAGGISASLGEEFTVTYPAGHPNSRL